MRYWDSSAIIPLVIAEATSPAIRRLYELDPGIFTWWATVVECTSAVARLQHDDLLSPDGAEQVFLELKNLQRVWQEVQPSEELREVALRILRAYRLRAADALQLASAVIAAEHHPASLEFVCLDHRLFDAARREGFRLTRIPE